MSNKHMTFEEGDYVEYLSDGEDTWRLGCVQRVRGDAHPERMEYLIWPEDRYMDADDYDVWYSPESVRPVSAKYFKWDTVYVPSDREEMSAPAVKASVRKFVPALNRYLISIGKLSLWLCSGAFYDRYEDAARLSDELARREAADALITPEKLSESLDTMSYRQLRKIQELLQEKLTGTAAEGGA